MKNITLLGSTGSIGRQTLEVVRNHTDRFHVCALAAGKNIDLLEEQIREFRPEITCIWSENDAKELERRVRSFSVNVLYGMEGLLECATLSKVDLVVAAMVGMIGLRPVIAAIKGRKDVGLANKETLVTAGHIIIPLAREKGVSILPIDSEHSAIFQCLQGIRGNQEKQVETIYLTASGGPFRGKTREELEYITPEDALCHPNWSMGQKITIDSATMMNKGLEVIEAKWLFNVQFDQIKVLVQPQSIIHSMVGFVDGSVIAQLGMPDMKVPIQYALTYPERISLESERIDFYKLGQISFEEPATDVLQGLNLAYLAGKIGGSMPTVMNAANELAVLKFLQKKIKFPDIYRMISYVMDRHSVIKNPNLEDILEIEKETYNILEKDFIC